MNELAIILQTVSELLRKRLTSSRLNDLANELRRIFVLAIKQKSILRDTSSRSLCQIGMQLVGETTSGIPYASIRSRLVSTMFALFTELLPHFLKEDHHGLGLKCDNLLTWSIALVEANEHDLRVYTTLKPSSIQRLCRSCLKHGISGSKISIAHTASKSLKLVRALLSRSASAGSDIEKVSQILPVPSACELFTMMTSHSKFASTLAETPDQVDGRDKETKLELLRLMLCCATTSTGPIRVAPEVWTAIYSAFDAGLGEIDTAIRQFFFACSKLDSQVSLSSTFNIGIK